MNSRPPQSNQSHDDAAAFSPASVAVTKTACSRRQIVAASGPNLMRETQALLRLRLRAAALILLIGFGAFLVRHVAGLLTGEPLDSLLLASHVLVVAVL